MNISVSDNKVLYAPIMYKQLTKRWGTKEVNCKPGQIQPLEPHVILFNVLSTASCLSLLLPKTSSG